MPALPNVANVLRVTTFIKDNLDTTSLNRFYVSYSGTAPTATQLDTFCTGVVTGWDSHMAPMYDVNSELTEVTAEDLTSPTAAVGIATGSTAGSRSGDALSAAACALISLKIARRYRGGHPRQYLSAGVITDLSNRQQWEGSFITALTTAYEAWNTATLLLAWSGGGALAFVNVSYYEGFTPVLYPSGRYRNVPKFRTAGPITDNIEGFAVNPNVCSQRRRNLAI
jgi:hypothetical protein